MYKLLIVDDEPLVREGLRLSITWEDYGFSVVGEASNGEEALTMVRELHPDVVITDMRMGVMDGLTLMQALNKNHFQIQIVILTAYNEFAYAKAAVDYNVFAYLSKPTLNEEIISVFCRLRDKMDELSMINKQLLSYKNYRADELLLQLLLTPKPSKDSIYEFCKCFNGVSTNRDFLIALLEIEAEKLTIGTSQTKQYLSFVLGEELDYCLSTNERYICKASLSPTNTVLLVFTGNHDFQQQISFLKELSDNFKSKTNAAVTIGVSAIFRSLTAIHRAYMQAQTAVMAKSRIGTGKIIDYMEISGLSNYTPTLSEAEIDEVVNKLIRGDAEKCELLLNGYFDSLENRIVDMQVIKSSIIELATKVLRRVFINSYAMSLVFGKNIRPASDIQELSGIGELREYTMGFLKKILLHTQCMQRLQILTGQLSPLVSDAIGFVSANFARDIRIGDIASVLHISESRLMHLFKLETGRSLNNFITEYRIRFAEGIIQSGHYKLYEVSELVGYKNPITFRKSFYKIVGINPSDYRQQGASDEL